MPPIKIVYLGLERLESRYTHQLEDWNSLYFATQEGVEFMPIHGVMPPAVEGEIVTGSVLDAHGRTHWSLTQMAKLVLLLQSGQLSHNDVIFFEDMFTPGIESLPYIFDQTPADKRPRVYVRCLAQTIDPDDFVHRTGMFKWMRRFEQMCASFVDGILCASDEMVAHLHIAGLQDVPIYVTGLPFGKAEVRSRVQHELTPYLDRPRTVVFAARWDDEKQPNFFMDVIEYVKQRDSSIQFMVLTGMKTLRSNNPELVARARRMNKLGLLHIAEGLSKNAYYALLADARVLFNCALQDWVSNTVSEADTFDTQTLYPAYRSFPEVFANDHRHMYMPWSVASAATRLLAIVNDKIQDTGRVSDYQNESIARTYDVFRNDTESPHLASPGVKGYRSSVPTHYRRMVSEPNYD